MSVLPALLTPAPVAKLHCPTDDWDFDPRYTNGVCPICGWGPGPAAPRELPPWARWVEKIQWDLVALLLLFVALAVLAYFVLRASDFKLT